MILVIVLLGFACYMMLEKGDTSQVQNKQNQRIDVGSTTNATQTLVATTQTTTAQVATESTATNNN